MKTCIIAANGPSINRCPKELLESEYTFGMNFAPFQPKAYVCIDSHILTEHADEIYPLAAGAEIAYLSAKHAGSSKLYDLPNVKLVDKDQASFKLEVFMSGLTATYVALKMAYYAGFQRVDLWGVDHSPDWRHYRDDYHAGAVNPNAEKMSVMMWHYGLVMTVYARAGRTIINHSDPSALDRIFRRSQ